MDQAYVIRHKVLVEGVSVRRVAREMGVLRNTLRRYVDRDVKQACRRWRAAARCRTAFARGWNRCSTKRHAGRAASSV